jgi:hypothetical protein
METIIRLKFKRQLFLGLLPSLMLTGLPSAASASPVTINFTGYFQLFDAGLINPVFWALEDELAANGVFSAGLDHNGVSHTGSPVQFSMTLNPAPNGTGTVLQSAFNVGGVYQFTTGPANFLGNGFIANASGPSITAGGLQMNPGAVNFLSGFGTPGGYQFTGNLNTDLTHVWQWRFGGLLNFNPGFQWAFYGLTPTSVSVPEPSALALMTSAIFIYVVRRRFRSR